MSRKVEKGRGIAGFIFLIIVMALVVILLNGVSINVPGAVCINTKYYSDPIEAFEAEESTGEINCGDYNGLEIVTNVIIDKYNSILICRNDNGQLTALQMKTKDGDYFYLGNSMVFGEVGEKDVFKADKLEVLGSRITSGIKYGGTIHCGLFKNDVQTYISENYTSQVLPEPYEDLVFIYY